MLLKINNSPRFSTIFFTSSKWIFSTLLESHMNFFAYADTTLLGLPLGITLLILPCFSVGSPMENKAKGATFHFLMLKNGSLCPKPRLLFSWMRFFIFLCEGTLQNKLVLSPENLSQHHYRPLKLFEIRFLTLLKAHIYHYGHLNFLWNLVVLMLCYQYTKKIHVILLARRRKSSRTCKVSKFSDYFQFSKIFK